MGADHLEDAGPEPIEASARSSVLVVDDEDEILQLVVPVLLEAGYLVYEAENGEEGLKAIEAFRPDVVVLDVMMPGLNGWEVCRTVRSNPDFATTRIIMASGIGEATNDATGALYGADDVLNKPFRLDELLRKVERLLEAPSDQAK